MPGRIAVLANFQKQLDANVIRCDDPIPPLYPEVPSTLASAATAATLPQGLTSFYSPIPKASWNTDEFKNCVAYIRTSNDTAVPAFMQQTMIDNATGPEWVVRDIESDHSPHLSHPEKLSEMLLELAQKFEAKT